MLRPVLHIHYSISAKIFEAMLMILPGLSVAGLVFEFPPLVIMFGLPVVLLLFLGLKSLLDCMINLPAVVLDRSGLRIMGVSEVLAWEIIDTVEGSTVLGKIPFRILNIHLKNNETSARISPGLAQTVGHMVGIKAKHNIKLVNIAITEERLAALIIDYKSNPADISDCTMFAISEKDLPIARRVINWSSSAFVMAIFVWLLVRIYH